MNCIQRNLDFVLKEGDPEHLSVEDDIRQDLAEVGLNVITRFVNSSDYVAIEENGDYNLFFTRSWGAPYDPHTYLSSWDVPSHVEYSAMGNLQNPSREELLQRVAQVQRELDPTLVQDQWTDILTDIHNHAVFLPLWGTRVPYVLSRRLGGFTPSSQTYTYPIETVRILEGSPNVTAACGTSGGSMLQSAGPLHPHQYFPNELFTQAWLYEGLVSYGQDGEIGPLLAKSWVEETTSSGQRVTFTLRQGVKFHDGSDFNCSVANLNFDHVLSDSAKQRHSWMTIVKVLDNWYCNAQDQFVLETNEPFYPLLQELSYIRPLTMAAPSTFANGLDSHPELENSCNPGSSKWAQIEAIEGFNCLGLSAPIGTGPFKYVSRDLDEDGNDNHVLFARHEGYWGAKPEIEFLKIETFDTTNEVEEALLSGDLDMALGIGPLSAKQVQKLNVFHSDVVDVRHSDVLQNSVLVMNTNKSPTDDINVRKAIIHAVNKGRFIEEEFGGLEQPVSQFLPKSAPYCNIDMNPKWSYDLEKAMLLNCPEGRDDLSSGAIAGIAVGVAVGVGLVVFVLALIRGERQGKPMFKANTKAEPV